MHDLHPVVRFCSYGLNIMAKKKQYGFTHCNFIVFFCHYAFSIRTIVFYNVILFKVLCMPRLHKQQDIWPPIMVSICLAKQGAGFGLYMDMCSVMVIL